MRLRWALTLALLAVGGPLFAADFEPTDLRIPMAAAGPGGLEAVVVQPRGAGREASEAAMSQCRQISGAACTLYAVDDEYTPAR